MAPGARNKFAAPMFEPEVFRKQMYCFEKVLMTLLGLFGPRSDSAPGESCPLAPLVTSLVLCNKYRKNSESKQIFKSEHHQNLHFSTTTWHGSCTVCRRRLLAAFQVSSCSFVSLGPVFVMLMIKFFGHSTSYFF